MSNQTPTRLSASQLLRAGSGAVLASVLVNVVARLLLGAVVALDPGFLPFSLGAIIGFTIIFTVIGVGVLVLVNRMAANPLRVYNAVAALAFFVSIIPNLLAFAGLAPLPMGGAGADYLTLIFFHITGIISFLGTLNSIARRA